MTDGDFERRLESRLIKSGQDLTGVSRFHLGGPNPPEKEGRGRGSVKIKKNKFFVQYG